MFYSLMHQRPDDKCHSPRLRRKRQVFVNIQRYIKSQWGGGEITHRDFIVRNTHHRSSVQMMSISYWQVAAC